MKKLTLLILVSLLSICGYGQLGLETFESPWTGSPAAPPGGWVVYNEVGTITWVQSTFGNTATPPYAGGHAAYLQRENVNPGAPIPTNWLITPQFNGPNNGRLHFYSRLTDLGDDGGIYKIKIAIVTDASVPATSLPWVDLVPPMTELELNPSQTEYVEKTFSLPASYVGQQIRIAFIMQGDQADRWLIDNLEVVSECIAPSSLSASNITLNSASLNWISPQGVTAWEVQYMPVTGVPSESAPVYTGALPYPVSGLAENTDYKFYVRSSCSDGGKSPLIGPFFFSTFGTGDLCSVPIIIPGTTLPYTTSNNTANFGDNYEGIPGTGCNATGNYLAGNDVVYSYTPTTSGTINLSLYNTAGNAAGIFVYNSCPAIGVNCIAGATASATAAGVIPTLAVTANTTYYIVVSTNDNPVTTPYTLAIQQVNCAAPTGLSASGQTVNSATLSWAAGTATSWQLAVQPVNAGLPTTGVNVTQNTINAINTSTGAPLLQATQYEYYVRTNCGDGTYSVWTGPFIFSTAQVATSLNYAESFDGPLPHGWSLSNGNQVNKWAVGSVTNNNATNSLFITNDNGVTNSYTLTAATVVHAYRDLQIPSPVGDISISFDYKVAGQANSDYIRAWLVPASFTPTPGTQITVANSGGVPVGANFPSSVSWTTQNIVVNASTFGGTTRRLVFEWTNNPFSGDQPAAAIDNVNVKVVTCYAPVAFALASVASGGATFSWTAPAVLPGGYEFYYAPSPTAGPNAATVPTSSISGGATTSTFVALPNSAISYVWIRSSCGTDKGFWIGPVAALPQTPETINYTQNFDSGSNGFTFIANQPNKWVVGSAVSNSAPNSLYISNDNGASNLYTNDFSVSQAVRDITIPVGVTELDIIFDYRCVGDLGVTTNNDYLRVWMVPTTFIPTPGTQTLAAAVGAGDRIKVGGDMNRTPNWTPMILNTDVSAYQGTTRRLVFEWRNDAGGISPPPAAIDNLNVKVVLCTKPTVLTVKDVSNTNATLDWTQTGPATNWEVAYMPLASAAMPTGPGIPVATNSEYTPAVGTFVYGVQYVYYVRAVCGGANWASQWAGPYTFALKPLNDECSAATVVLTNPDLNCTNIASGSIIGATQSSVATTCTGTPDDDIWFAFVATSTSHRIVLQNITGSTAVLNHVLYSGSCGALTQLYCSANNESWANNILTVGQTYYIRVYTNVATPLQTTAFKLCVGTPLPPPANDDCAGATTVPVNPTMLCEQNATGSVQFATASAEGNTCGNTSDDDDVWFEFTATSTAHTIDLNNITGSTIDLYHAVYTGDVCGTLTQLYCSDANSSFATNFTVGETYKIRVWTNTTAPNQSSAFEVCVRTPPPPPSNDQCANAVIVPVNQTSVCDLFASGSLYGATGSPEPNNCPNLNDDDDIWFEFTATHPKLLISLKHIVGSTVDLYHAVYAGNQCGSLTQLYCSDSNSSVADNLIVGNVYKVRVYSNTATPNQTSTFDICIRVPNTSVTVNTSTFSTEQLVREILVNSPCALVNNITSISGPDFGDDPSIGYFDANGAAFPFAYGVVLTTGAVSSVPANPYTSDNSSDFITWAGDDELNDIVLANDINKNKGLKNASVLEFDFIPLTNLFKFDFLFAGNEYGANQCGFTDAFAFILTDSNGNSTNLAVVPNTNVPVSVTTIKDGQYSLNGACGSNNEAYFGQYNTESPLGAAINFRGQTVPMVASSNVIPNTQYHIKMVIADYSDPLFNSAVFLGGGTFDVGHVELGGDLLVADGNALCERESTILDTGLTADDYVFQWFKDGITINGETGPTYEVTEPGTYGVEASFENVTCSYEGVVVVEYYPFVEDLIGDPVDMIACDASGFSTFDITTNLDTLLTLPADPENFTVSVHLNEDDAKTGNNPIDPASYTSYTNVTQDLQTLWTRILYSVTGCAGIKSFDLVVQDLTPQYTIDTDFSICNGTSDTIDVVVTDSDPTPVTYTWTKDDAPLADTTPSITVTEAGAYIVVLDRAGCSTAATVNVVVTPIPVADTPADVTVCTSYVLPALSANNTYYNSVTNTEVAAGTEITETTIFTIVASSGTTPECISQSTFTVTVNNAPEIAAIADVSACDTYALPNLSVGNYFTAAGGTGSLLNAGDEITSTQTIYVYAETGTVPNCTAEESFIITITPSPVADAPVNVQACDNYILPALSPGNSYYSQQGGVGAPIPVGTVISSTQLIYVFATTGTTPACTDENSFTVEITPTPAFNLGGPYVSCTASSNTITVAGTNFNEIDATYQWTLNGATLGDGSSITATEFGTYTLTVSVGNCTHTESVEVTQNTDAIPVLIIEGCKDDSYYIGVTDDNGSFNIDTATYLWTGPNSFTSQDREFIAPAAGEYIIMVTTADGCISEDSFIVTDTSCEIQRGISPNGDTLNDEFDLSSLEVKKLSIFNRYGKEVYSKDNYSKEWKGQTNDGKELPTGTYFYMFERKNGESKTGWIYINRQD